MSEVSVGPDGRARCPWATSAPEYVAYHDEEWGRPVRTADGLYERLTLEAFQSGLSWLTILRKRDNFRRAFDRFDPAAVAAYGPADVERLLGDAGIIRNRSKINAAIHNAAVVARARPRLPRDLRAATSSATVPRPATWPRCPPRPRSRLRWPASLKKHGIRFVGPTTAYALMQAVGLVDDHLQDCQTAP